MADANQINDMHNRLKILSEDTAHKQALIERLLKEVFDDENAKIEIDFFFKPEEIVG